MCATVFMGGCGSAAYVNGSDTPAAASSVTADTAREAAPVSDDTPSEQSADTVTAQDTAAQTDNTSQAADAPASSTDAAQSGDADISISDDNSSGKGSRDNSPRVLVPTQPGTEVYGNDLVEIDTSNSSEGYISVIYYGSSPKVKLQITCPNSVTYTYNLTGGWEVFPLTIDSGTYSIGVFENISGSEYSTCYRADIPITVSDEFGPYLYPNQYVNFSPNDECVAVASELAYPANTDLDVVSNVYNYITQNVTYDTELANSVESGYLPDPDRTLNSCTGICLDYACLMASMLRSQGIPTHMEVGYASTAYHAWISVYLQETGWVNGIIEFNGTSWELMDPTFAASASASELQEFIGDGSNYETKYIY